jgi:hypothetical protein
MRIAVVAWALNLFNVSRIEKDDRSREQPQDQTPKYHDTRTVYTPFWIDGIIFLG